MSYELQIDIESQDYYWKIIKARRVANKLQEVGRSINMELPELTVLSRQMKEEIVGKRISSVEVANPKCLNIPLEDFQGKIIGKTIKTIENRGKWLFIHLDKDLMLLFNPGMGVDILHFRSEDKSSEKYNIKFTFGDTSGFTIRVRWFCFLHLVSKSNLGEHKFTAELGPTPMDETFTLDYFRKLLQRKHGNIKSFLVNQKRIAGIGNVYIQDILFNARVHPKRKIQTLNDKGIEALYNSMRSILAQSIELRGLAYERDFYGSKGGYGKEQFKVAYKADQSCPICTTTIQKIKTGSTSSYICPNCQKIDA